MFFLFPILFTFLNIYDMIGTIYKDVGIMRKVALVLGASSAIGYAIVEEFIQKEYDLSITYYKRDERVKKLSSASILVTKCDITKEEDIVRLIDVTIQKFGKIDLLVNNVGVALDHLISEKTKQEFLQVLDTNVVGPFLVVKHALNYLDGGVVIHIASTDGIDTYNEYDIDYSVSKAALIHMTKALAYALPNIKFYAVAPNFVDTEPIREMNPIFLKEELQRVGQTHLIKPIEVAKTVLCLTDGKRKSGSIIVLRGDENE